MDLIVSADADIPPEVRPRVQAAARTPDSMDWTPDSSVCSSQSTRSSKSENIFFANITPDVNVCAEMFEEPDPVTPTTLQRNLCLDATSDVNTNLTDDEDSRSPPTGPAAVAEKLCLCAASKPQPTQEAAQRPARRSLTSDSMTDFPAKLSPITDDYRITHEIIGIGESGKVMACFSRRDNSKFALKVLRDGPKSRREVQLHYLTNHHPNIVTIEDIYENTFDGVKCLLVVIEFLEAGDLLTQFENQHSRPYSEATVAEIVRQIGAAVQYLHSMNIAHRDIKLENILCSSSDRDSCLYKLADFGFAKRPERNHLMESPCCTPIYVAPEVLSHELYDKSCDMWSLGVVMYILLCGYPPFYSMKGLPLSPGMKTRITTGLYAFPPDEWDHVTQDAKDEIRHLLRTDPASRSTIGQLMGSAFVTRQLPGGGPMDSPMPSQTECSSAASSDSGCVEESDEPTTPETPEALAELNVPRQVRRTAARIATHAASVRQVSRTQRAKPPRLHSIQEEVGRAMDQMRLNENASIPLKSLKLSGNSLYERRCKKNPTLKLNSEQSPRC